MGVLNVYSSWCISKVLLATPSHIKTFGDIGEFSLGVVGRYLANISQLITCIMVPTMFLVAGGTIFTVLFPLTFKLGVWILFMTICLLPVCLLPTLKEGAGTLIAGSLGTIIANAIALGVLIHEINKQNEGLSPPPVNVTFSHLTTVVGNCALAFGAGVIIPTLHREHSDPSRMPRIIWVTMGFATLLFLIIGILGFHKVGCQLPDGSYGNVLFVIATPYLGFISNRGTVIVAMIAMQIHNVVAYGVILFPAFYIAERKLLGLHATAVESEYNDMETPNFEKEKILKEKAEASRSSLPSVVRPSMLEPIEYPEPEGGNDYKTPGTYFKASILRILIVAVSFVVAVLGQKDLGNLVNFLGASMISLCCIILPIAFYLKVYWLRISQMQRAWGVFWLLVSIFIAIYATIVTGKALFGSKDDDAPRFPFCEEKYQDTIYTNRTHYKY
ncbi:Amino Acid/Auxin Permease (AAAP) Family [Thraustotheca clavata]|uniref:Amino Acid/Auxin Permease (AAAP) Family n=1 Tax=Thraustotheca clavata TaxID=74557 RepID=A0A1V9YDA9_9STRA|nr:Amino Acid/Auxin Permease (AAAP) Family [Thraustotheca clavata]